MSASAGLSTGYAKDPFKIGGDFSVARLPQNDENSSMLKRSQLSNSTKKISPQLIARIEKVLKDKAWGSVEIYVQNYEVTQITDRNIHKTTESVARPE